MIRLLSLVIAGVLVFGVSTAGGLRGSGVITASSARIAIATIPPASSQTALGTITVRQFLLYNRPAYNKSIGSAVTICQYIGRGKLIGGGASACFGTYRFARGNIEVRGILSSNESYLLAVVGGTGYYAAVGGVLRVLEDPKNPLRRALLFQLIGQ